MTPLNIEVGRVYRPKCINHWIGEVMDHPIILVLRVRPKQSPRTWYDTYDCLVGDIVMEGMSFEVEDVEEVEL